MLRVSILILFICAFTSNISALAQAASSKEQIEQATIAFSDSPTADARRHLNDLLSTYQGPPTVQSINGHLTLFYHDAPSEDFSLIRETATATFNHLEPVSEIMPRQYLDARFLAAVAAFNAEKDENTPYELAHVQGLSKQVEPDGAWPDWAKSTHYLARAWGLATVADLEADEEKTVSRETYDEIINGYPPRTPVRPEYGALPNCDGEFRNRAKVKYPRIAAKQGQWGAVILQYDLNDEGRVTNESVLAAIPEGAFEQAALKWVKKYRFRAENRDQVGVTCRLNRRGIVQDLVFQID